MTIYTKAEKDKLLASLQNIEKLKTVLETTNDNMTNIYQEQIKVKDLNKLAGIYFSSPKNFKEAMSNLNKREKKVLIDLSILKSNNIIMNEMSGIFINKDPTISQEDLEKHFVDTNANLAGGYELLNKKYNELRIELSKVNTINPLELIDYPDDHKFADLFSLNADFMIKQIGGFLIKSLDETKNKKIRTKKGQIDFPRTIKSSMKYEGTPYELIKRSKDMRIRKNKPKIYFLIDTSGSQSAGTYFSVCITYAIASALKDVDMVIYTAADTSTNISGCIPDLRLAERKNLTRIKIVNSSERFNKNTIMEYMNKPDNLVSLIKSNRRGGSDNTFYVIKGLVNECPENSLFLNFGDTDQFNISDTKTINIKNFDGLISQRDRALIKKKFKNKMFYFHTSRFWDKNSYLLKEYDRKVSFGTYFSSNDLIYFPDISDRPKVKTYKDMVDNILKVISDFAT